MLQYLVMCSAAILNAQGGGAAWNDLRSKNPPGIDFHLRLMEPQPYRQGELLRMELKLPAPPPPASAPAKEMWHLAGFLIDPHADCGTMAKPCMVWTLRDGPSAPPSNPMVFALNSYLPALAPGRYRLAALVRKQVLKNTGPASVTYGYADPAQYAVSEVVAIEIVAATAEWVRQTIAKSVATFSAPQPRSGNGYQAHEEAAEQISFLDDPAA